MASLMVFTWVAVGFSPTVRLAWRFLYAIFADCLLVFAHFFQCGPFQVLGRVVVFLWFTWITYLCFGDFIAEQFCRFAVDIDHYRYRLPRAGWVCGNRKRSELFNSFPSTDSFWVTGCAAQVRPRHTFFYVIVWPWKPTFCFKLSWDFLNHGAMIFSVVQ